MPITAQATLTRVATTLQETDMTRWTVAELVHYYNDGQREIIIYRPDATATNVALTAVAGARQTLPTTAFKLIDLLCNTASKKALRLTDMKLLDAQVPGWRAGTQTTDAVNFMFDARDPRTYHVYPPATATASYDAVVSAYPTDIAEPVTNTVASVTGNCSLADQYVNALADYVLYRAFAKDAEFAASAQRAAMHYQMFANAVGIDLRAGVVQPTAATQQ